MEIAPVICLLFEKTLQTGQLPSEMKKAQVCPLFKMGDKTEPSNYKPIPLTCILCKVIERIIASNISKHLNKHNALYELQHGFCVLMRDPTYSTCRRPWKAANFGKANKFVTFGF